MTFLSGLFTPSCGSAKINGYSILTDMDQIRQNLGICPQHNILFDRLPKGLQRFLGMLSDTVCFSFFAILAYQLMKKAFILKDAGEVSETLRIAYYPFIIAVSVGVFVLSLVLINDLFDKLGAKD